MNARIAAALVALLVVLGGSALLYRQQHSATRAANVGALGQPLLKDLKAAEVQAIRIAAPQGALTLALADGRWRIAERGGFPADFEKVRGFVLKAIELKVAQSEPLGGEDRARLSLAEPGRDGAGTLVEFQGAEGKPLARLLVGKKYFKREPADAAQAAGDGRFVLRPDEPKTVLIVADPLAQASAQSADWLERSGFSAERIGSLELRPAQGGGWKIERARDDAGWKLAGARPGEKLEVSRANAAAYALSMLELADVAPADLAPAATGLDKPSVARAQTLDGLAYTLKIGKSAGENLYASVELGGALARTRKPEAGEKSADRERRDKEHAERVAKIEERLARERAIAGRVVLVATSRLDDLLKPRAELLEKKAAKK